MLEVLVVRGIRVYRTFLAVKAFVYSSLVTHDDYVDGLLIEIFDVRCTCSENEIFRRLLMLLIMMSASVVVLE